MGTRHSALRGGFAAGGTKPPHRGISVFLFLFLLIYSFISSATLFIFYCSSFSFIYK